MSKASFSNSKNTVQNLYHCFTHFRLAIAHLKEPIHDPTTSRHKHAEPPPLISPNIAISALEQDFMRRKVALNFACSGGRGNE
jgi:hypothetical protein